MSHDAYAAVTHVGQVRTNNEDAHLATDTVWMVADGMGGHAAGEVASQLAVEAVVAADPHDEPGLRDAFARAHQAVVDASGAEKAGMGTTLLVATLEASGGVLIGNVGDSRAYLLADGVLNRLTTDDNEAEMLLSEGRITAEQAREHPGQFILTASLGGWRSAAPKPAVHLLPARVGRLLLCSDGLNGELTDTEIAGALAEGGPAHAAQRLVDEAVRAGGRDNVTVVVVDL